MSNLMKDSIIDIIDKYFPIFLNKQNVTGIGLGEKIIGNKNTMEPCLHIGVSNKIPEDKLYENDLIPKTFLGFKTDVVASKSYKAYDYTVQSNTSTPDFKSLKRPIEAGYSISSASENSAGTIGAIVFDNYDNTPYILSNNHVLSKANLLSIGEPIVQPGIYDGGAKASNVIAHLYKKVMFNLDEETPNYVDCAIAKIAPNVKYNNNIYNIGVVQGTITPEVGDYVKKVGRTTGYTSGFVLSTNYYTNLFFKKGGLKHILKEQIKVTQFSKMGDSGSLVVDKNNRAIGLILSIAPGESVICPIDKVLLHLNIHF